MPYDGPSQNELDIEQRVEELRHMSCDVLSLAKDIIFKAIAHEEFIAKTKKRYNLNGLSNLLKLYITMEGWERPGERDVSLELPDDIDSAIEKLIKMRARGELKSIQANDLASLVAKKTEFVKLKEIGEMIALANKKAGLSVVDEAFEIQERSDEEQSNH